MKNLENYVKSCLNFANNYCKTKEDKEHMFHQAYGAIAYYASIHSDETHNLDELWEKYRYKFN